MNLTLIESTTDSKRLPSYFFLSIVPPSIPLIIKPTTSISNVSTNSFSHTQSNSYTPGIQGYGGELANWAKMYKEKAKYSSKNDSFTFKLTIFHDVCAREDVPHKIKLMAFPTMLIGLALDYYYSNVSISTSVTFDEVCNSIRTYFERAENRRSVLSRWNNTILKSIMEKNERKPIEDCIQLLIKDLHHLQYGLDVELCTDKFIYNKLISTGQDVPACQYACFKPADGLAGFINDLRLFVLFVCFN